MTVGAYQHTVKDCSWLLLIRKKLFHLVCWFNILPLLNKWYWTTLLGWVQPLRGNQIGNNKERETGKVRLEEVARLVAPVDGPWSQLRDHVVSEARHAPYVGSAPHLYRFNIYLLLHSIATATYCSLILTIAYVLSLKGVEAWSFTAIICTLLTKGIHLASF